MRSKLRDARDHVSSHLSNVGPLQRICCTINLRTSDAVLHSEHFRERSISEFFISIGAKRTYPSRPNVRLASPFDQLATPLCSQPPVAPLV